MYSVTTPFAYFTSPQDILVVGGMFVLPAILSLIALIDCAIRPFRDGTHKILWILIAPVLGPLAYAIAGRKMASAG